jgi:hypothetical protein
MLVEGDEMKEQMNFEDLDMYECCNTINKKIGVRSDKNKYEQFRLEPLNPNQRKEMTNKVFDVFMTINRQPPIKSYINKYAVMGKPKYLHVPLPYIKGLYSLKLPFGVRKAFASSVNYHTNGGKFNDFGTFIEIMENNINQSLDQFFINQGDKFPKLVDTAYRDMLNNDFF